MSDELQDQYEDQTDETQPDEEVEEVTDEPDPPKAVEVEPEWAQRLSRGVETLINAQNRFNNNPTPQNEAGQQKAESRLRAILDQSDIDIDAVPALKSLANEVLDQDRKMGETQAQYDSRLARMEQMLQTMQAEQQYRSTFDKQYPELSGRYEELKQQAFKGLEDAAQKAYASNDPMVIEMFQGRYADRWNSLVEKEASKIKSKKESSPTPKPKGTSPVKGRAGQASRSQPARSLAERIYGGDST